MWLGLCGLVVLSVRGYVLLFCGVLFVLLGVAGIGWPYTLLVGSMLVSLVYLVGRLGSRYEASLDNMLVERSFSRNPVFEGSDVDVVIGVGDRGGYGIPLLRIIDEPPYRVRVSGEPVVETTLPRLSSTSGSYRVRPCMGMHSFEYITLVAQDSFRLYSSWRRLRVSGRLRAYPVYSGLAEALRRTINVWFGGVKTRYRKGVGYDLYELREYVPGDDYRRIVWTAFARTGKLFVREDETESYIKIHLILDFSRKSWAGLGCDCGVDHIGRAALSIIAGLLGRNDRVGYTIYRGDRWVIRTGLKPYTALDKLSTDLSLQSIKYSSTRVRLYRMLLESIGASPDSIIIILSSWGLMRRDHVEALTKALAITTKPKILLYIIPVTSGIEKIASLEAEYLRKYTGVLHGAGIIPVVLRGWEWAGVGLRVVGEVLARYALY